MSARPAVAILEDDLASADALAFILRDWGADPVHGLTCDELVGKLGGECAEVRYVIADFNIGPHPNGVEAARAFLKHAPAARVLILTGTFHRRGEVAALSAGFDLMFKPSRAEDIIAWLERA